MKGIIIFVVVYVAVFVDLSPEERIVGGQNATDGEFPYMVALRLKNDTPGLICGGTVITKSYVLTAAHCCDKIRKKNDFYVYAGSIYLSKGGSNHSILNITRHYSYKPDSAWEYDFCVIKVSPSFTFGAKLNQVTLASYRSVLWTRDRVTVAGWGLAMSKKMAIPDRLQKGVDFVLMSKTECERSTGLKLCPSHICAREARGWQATWKGDSGGPLTMNGVQIGVASFGYHPSGARLPTVYARVMNIDVWLEFRVENEANQLKFVNITR